MASELLGSIEIATRRSVEWVRVTDTTGWSVALLSVLSRPDLGGSVIKLLPWEETGFCERLRFVVQCRQAEPVPQPPPADAKDPEEYLCDHCGRRLRAEEVERLKAFTTEELDHWWCGACQATSSLLPAAPPAP